MWSVSHCSWVFQLKKIRQSCVIQVELTVFQWAIRYGSCVMYYIIGVSMCACACEWNVIQIHIYILSHYASCASHSSSSNPKSRQFYISFRHRWKIKIPSRMKFTIIYYLFCIFSLIVMFNFILFRFLSSF